MAVSSCQMTGASLLGSLHFEMGVDGGAKPAIENTSHVLSGVRVCFTLKVRDVPTM